MKRILSLIRVSNLLNFSYLSENKLKQAILNLKKILKENSIVCVNRRPKNSKKIQQVFY